MTRSIHCGAELRFMKPISVIASTELAAGLARQGAQFKLVHTRRTFEEVTAQVRELLLGGSLKPGDRLPAERDLAKMLGVGRPALREALRALEAAGLIELRKGKTGGAFISTGKPSVVSDSMSDLLRLGNVAVEELFEARLWIQTALVRAACARITQDDLKVLHANVVLAERQHAEGKYEERSTTNVEFHNLLAQATRNPVAVMVIRGLTDALRGLIRRVGTELTKGTFSARYELLKALEARDEHAAAEALARIIKNAEQTYKRLAQQGGNVPPPTLPKRASRATVASRKGKAT
jgi:GntR family transcriptional regulator, transcriptional repressor for pyruvate dehydrogenase complex